MPAPKNAIPSVVLHTAIPEDVYGRLAVHLYSELEGRIPKGAFKAFLSQRIKEFLSNSHLDLAPYTNEAPGLVVSGTPEAIEILERLLRK